MSCCYVWTRDIAMFLGSSIGRVNEVDGGASEDCLGRFLRVRAAVDVTQALKRCSNRVHVMGAGELQVVLPLAEVNMKGLSSGAGGTSPTGGGNPSRGRGRWKMRARRKWLWMRVSRAWF
ncbi:hypothetical protein ACOSQ2_030792 [Xanthoceras sorbifolium]